MTRIRRRRFTDPQEAQNFEDVPTLHASGAAQLIPADRIDSIVTRYVGRRIPLDLAFPEPPKANLPPNKLGGFNSFEHSDVLTGVYQREAQLKLMHRLLMRNASMQSICEALGVSAVMAARLRRELHERLAKEALSINGGAFTGKTLAFYDEVRAQALKEADKPGATPVNKARFLAVALAAEGNKHRFLNLVGFYKNLQVSPAMQSAETDDGGMALIRGMLKAITDPQAYADMIEGDQGMGGNLLTAEPDHDVNLLG